jgi:glycosyltransferase involved in cell wall biosynthesis
MRIARYHPRAAVGDGGLTFAVRRWSLALADLGVGTRIVHAGGPAPDDTDLVTWRSVRHVPTPLGGVPVGLRDAFRGVDLVILQSGWTLANDVAARSARAAGIPYLLEPRGAYDPHILARHRRRKAAWLSVVEGRIIDGARGIHVFFDDERAHLAALGYRGSVVVAPNGIDAPPAATWLGDVGGSILWFGRLDLDHKGLDLIVRGVAALHPRARPHVRLHGAGPASRRAELEALVRRLDVADHVGIWGPVYGDDKERAVASCAAFVYPSRWEAFGFAPAEAVVRGVPLLATPYPLARYLAARHGAIVVDATPAGLAQGLERITATGSAALGQAGRAVALEDFRWSDVATRWLRQVEVLA